MKRKEQTTARQEASKQEKNKLRQKGRQTEDDDDDNASQEQEGTHQLADVEKLEVQPDRPLLLLLAARHPAGLWVVPPGLCREDVPL